MYGFNAAARSEADNEVAGGMATKLPFSTGAYCSVSNAFLPIVEPPASHMRQAISQSTTSGAFTSFLQISKTIRTSKLSPVLKR